MEETEILTKINENIEYQTKLMETLVESIDELNKHFARNAAASKNMKENFSSIIENIPMFKGNPHVAEQVKRMFGGK